MTYTWRDALSEYWQYAVVLFAYGFIISLISSWPESRLRIKSYPQILTENFISSFVGVLVITVLWLAPALGNENARIAGSPVAAFLAAFAFKIALLKRTNSLTIKDIAIRIIHPAMFVALPALFVLYIYALGSAWRN